MSRFFTKKSVALILTTIVLFGFFNIYSAEAIWPLGSVVDKTAIGILSILTEGLATLYSSFLNFVIIPLASFCLAAIGLILDYSIDFSIYGKGFSNPDMLAGIKSIWMLIRDTANITFIFLLLYAGIQQIISQTPNKKVLVAVITSAVLINFSFFITRVVIDAGNITATAIYNQIGGGGQLNGNASAKLVQDIVSLGDFKSGVDLSGRIMSGMDITTIWDVTGKGESILSDSFSNGPDSITGIGGMINSSIKLLKILVLFFVFIFLAVIFIGRFIMLAILMATSPIGFLGDTIPWLKDLAGKWRHELTNQVLIAPAIMFFMLLTIRLSASLPPSTNVFISFFNFFFVVYLLMKSINIVKGMSGDIGKFADMAAKAVGGAALAATGAGAALAVRGTLGAAASRVAGSKFGTRLEGLANSDNRFVRGFGKTLTGGINRTASSSFDIRNTPGFSRALSGIGLQTDEKLANYGKNEGGYTSMVARDKETAQKKAEAIEARSKGYQQQFVDTTITNMVREERDTLEKQLANETDPNIKKQIKEQVAKKNQEIADLSNNGTAVLEKMKNLELQEEIETLTQQKINEPDPVIKQQIQDKIDKLEKERGGLTKVEDPIKATQKVTDLQNKIQELETRTLEATTERLALEASIAADLAAGVPRADTTKDNELLRKLKSEVDNLQDRTEKTQGNLKAAKEDKNRVIEENNDLNRYRSVNTEKPVSEVLSTKNRRADYAARIRNRQTNFTGSSGELARISESAAGIKPK